MSYSVFHPQRAEWEPIQYKDSFCKQSRPAWRRVWPADHKASTLHSGGVECFVQRTLVNKAVLFESSFCSNGLLALLHHPLLHIKNSMFFSNLLFVKCVGVCVLSGWLEFLNAARSMFADQACAPLAAVNEPLIDQLGMLCGFSVSELCVMNFTIMQHHHLCLCYHSSLCT